jgi:hypothetical protein
MLRLVLDPFRFNDYQRSLIAETVDTGRPGGGRVSYPIGEAAAALEEHRGHQAFMARKKVSPEKALTRALEDMAESAGRMLALGVTTSAKMKSNDLTAGRLADLDEVHIGYEPGDAEHLRSIEGLVGELAQRKIKPGERYHWGHVYQLVETAKKVHSKISEARLKERFREAFYRGYRLAKGKTLAFPTRALKLLSAADLKGLLWGYVRSGELRRDTEYSQAELIAFMRERGHVDDTLESGFLNFID